MSPDNAYYAASGNSPDRPNGAPAKGEPPLNEDRNNSPAEAMTANAKPQDAESQPQSQDQAQAQDPSESHMHGFKLAITIVGLALSIFCVALDNTIIATPIPRITDEFHALQDVGWYGSCALFLPTPIKYLELLVKCARREGETLLIRSVRSVLVGYLRFVSVAAYIPLNE